MISFLTAKDQLYNDLVDLLKQKDCFFPNSMSDTESTKNVNVLVNALWLIDKDNLKKLQQKIAALKNNNQESEMRYYSSLKIKLLNTFNVKLTRMCFISYFL